MTDLFKLINISLKNELTLDDLITELQFTTPNKKFSQYGVKNKDFVDKIFDKKIRFLIPPDGLQLTEIFHPGATPHIDRYGVTLNYYFTAYGEITNFYETNYTPEKKLISNLPRHLKTNLKLLAELKANSHECYLINTRNIHAIQLNTKQPRFILRYFWKDHTYNDIKDSIQYI